jgi:branched-chain amino acid transport system substrate-binding protein
MKKYLVRSVAHAAALALPIVLAITSSAHAETVKIAFVDALSGPMANVGETMLKNLQFAADQINAKGGVLGGKTLEIVPFDTKMSPKEAIIALKQASDAKIHFMVHAISSSVGSALLESVNRQNERYPDNRMLYLNYGSVDTSFTNAKCSFWFYRFAANSDMKTEAKVNEMAANRSIKKLFIIAQDFPTAHDAVDLSIALLKKKRPDIEIVGTEFHPMGRVKDFTPYAGKIRSSGADTVIAASFGNDLTLLIRSGREVGLQVNYYTFYANGLGVPGAIGDAGVGKVKLITEWHNSAVQSDAMERYYTAFKQKNPDPKDEFISFPGKIAIEMLARAIDKAKSTDPRDVALALEGMKHASETGEVTMRKEDHQALLPLFVATLEKKGAPGVPHDLDGSGFGFKNNVRIDPQLTTLPTTCNMVRPAK